MLWYLDDRGGSRTARTAVGAGRRAALAAAVIVALLLVSLAG